MKIRLLPSVPNWSSFIYPVTPMSHRTKILSVAFDYLHRVNKPRQPKSLNLIQQDLKPCQDFGTNRPYVLCCILPWNLHAHKFHVYMMYTFRIIKYRFYLRYHVRIQQKEGCLSFNLGFIHCYLGWCRKLQWFIAWIWIWHLKRHM